MSKAPLRGGLRERLRGSWRVLLKEITAFGLVGAIAFVVQMGLFNYLYYHHHIGPLTANAVGMIVSVAVAYVGNRYLSFSHRARSGLAREAAFFFIINAIAFVFAEALLALFAYPFGFRHDGFVMNVVNVVGIGLGTLFRFWAYKRFVFLAPDRVTGPSADGSAEPVER
ncbi:MAG: GtrA family protein [Actinomycetia bacterium]|nr:GtrA family protein [Actinomycetes bacterium]